jgi:hypothetical protein
LMVLIARGRIEDTDASTFTFSTAHDYLLADDCGHEILYLLEGDPDYIGPFETYLVEVRGELAGTDPSSRYEILEVKSIYRNDRNA